MHQSEGGSEYQVDQTAPVLRMVLRVAAVLFATGIWAGMVFGCTANRPATDDCPTSTTVPTTVQPWCEQ